MRRSTGSVHRGHWGTGWWASAAEGEASCVCDVERGVARRTADGEGRACALRSIDPAPFTCGHSAAYIIALLRPDVLLQSSLDNAILTLGFRNFHTWTTPPKCNKSYNMTRLGAIGLWGNAFSCNVYAPFSLYIIYLVDVCIKELYMYWGILNCIFLFAPANIERSHVSSSTATSPTLLVRGSQCSVLLN